MQNILSYSVDSTFKCNFEAGKKCKLRQDESFLINQIKAHFANTHCQVYLNLSPVFEPIWRLILIISWNGKMVHRYAGLNGEHGMI